jgi:hypothetical protein
LSLKFACRSNTLVLATLIALLQHPGEVVVVQQRK